MFVCACVHEYLRPDIISTEMLLAIFQLQCCTCISATKFLIKLQDIFKSFRYSLEFRYYKLWILGTCAYNFQSFISSLSLCV